jgi:hypothetical protein
MPDTPVVPITPPTSPVLPGPTVQDIQKQIEELRNSLLSQDQGDQGVEVGAAPTVGGIPVKTDSTSKWMINISFVVFGLCGVVGSVWQGFDMTKYTQFLQTFAYIWAPLVVAVGGGRAFKNWVSKKYVPPETPLNPSVPASVAGGK